MDELDDLEEQQMGVGVRYHEMEMLLQRIKWYLLQQVQEVGEYRLVELLQQEAELF